MVNTITAVLAAQAENGKAVARRKTNSELKIQIHSRCIGSRHDPYDATTITIQRGSVIAIRYQDGLGCERVRVSDGVQLLAEREWFYESSRTKLRMNQLYANLVVKRYLGVTCDQAEEMYEESYMEDPIHFSI